MALGGAQAFELIVSIIDVLMQWSSDHGLIKNYIADIFRGCYFLTSCSKH